MFYGMVLRFYYYHYRASIDCLFLLDLRLDIGWGFGDVRPLFSYFYNTNPEGVINNRWGSPHSDFTTPV
jgi:alpha-L-fucosidase